MPETHMLKPYSQRVKSTYDLMVCFMQQAAQDAEEIYRLKQNARAELIHQKKFPLKWRKDALIHDEIIFKGYATDSAKSKATGLMAMYYNRNKPYTAKIPFYNFFHGENAVSAPRAYLIPQGWHEVIERLKQNNVLMHALHQDTLIAVSVYRIEDYKSYSKAYEQHHKNYAVRVSQKTVSEKFRKGDYLIFTNQPAKRYLVEMLEPEAEDGFFSWNFFDAILQQKEGYSDYRWDELAAKWLSENPDLQNKLAEKKRLDPKFALDHKAILAYLYTNSPYAEKGYREYPVYRVEY